MEEVMKLPALAQYLRCDPMTLYRLLKRREIPAFKVGTNWRFRRSDIEKWIAGSRVMPSAEAAKTRPGAPQSARSKRQRQS
jgi:excisionase family DNA binding protein